MDKPRVKPLEWRHITSTGGRNVHETTNGPYSYTAWPNGSWRLRKSYVGGIAPKDRTLAGAKAAAQADYEARIIAALEPVTARTLTAAECTSIVEATEPAEMTEEGDRRWTRRMGEALARALAERGE